MQFLLCSQIALVGRYYVRTGWQTSVNIHGRCGGSLFLKKDVFEIHLNGAGCVWGGAEGESKLRAHVSIQIFRCLAEAVGAHYLN